MADKNKFLHLGNYSDKILYENFKGKLEQKDIAANSHLLQIFKFFDKDGSGALETTNSNGVNEIQSLWNSVKTSASKNSNSIFEYSEAEEFLANSVDETGKSLADNKVTSGDLFSFLKILANKDSEPEPHNLRADEIRQYTPKEIQELSIQTICDDINKAKEILDAQKAAQGQVSEFVNDTKETFDTEYAYSRVNRYLMKEEFCAKVLQYAKDGILDEKQYLEAKLELAVQMLSELENTELKATIAKQIVTLGLYKDFGNKTKAEQERIVKEKEIEFLKKALARLTPDELTVFIKRLTSLSDEEYKEKTPKVVENLINQTIQENEAAISQSLGDSVSARFIAPPKEGSIEDIISNKDAYRVMNFDEVFQKERGVMYNSSAIMEYTVRETQLQFLLGIHNRNESIKNILHDATVIVDGNNKNGAPQKEFIENCNQNLANQIEVAFKSLYAKNAYEAQRVIDEIMGKDSGITVVSDEQGNFIKLEFYGFERKTLGVDSLNESGQETVESSNDKLLKRMPIDSYSLVQLSKGLQEKLDENYKKLFNDRSLEDYSEDVKLLYEYAYGAKNAQDVANAFAQSQQAGVQYTKAAVQGAGMLAMVAGQLIPVGGQAATALLATKTALSYSGILISVAGGTAVSAAENYSKEGGPTEEDKRAMLEELRTSLALFGSGVAIGKGSEALYRTLVMKYCPKLVALGAEVGVDATASLLADYAITGQIDLSGEGIAQLQNILIGIICAKGNIKNYLQSHGLSHPDIGKMSNEELLSEYEISNYDRSYWEDDKLLLRRMQLDLEMMKRNLRGDTYIGKDMSYFESNLNLEMPNTARILSTIKENGSIFDLPKDIKYTIEDGPGVHSHLRFEENGKSLFLFYDKNGDIISANMYGLQIVKVGEKFYDASSNLEYRTRSVAFEEAGGYKNTNKMIRMAIDHNIPQDIVKIIQKQNAGKDYPLIGPSAIREIFKNTTSADDVVVLRYLLNDKQFADMMQTYKSQDIVSIMKSPEAKSLILSRIKNNQSISKSEIKKVVPEIFGHTDGYKLNKVRDLSYKTQDIESSEITSKMTPDEIKNAYITNPKFKSDVDSKCPAGEVCTINGKLYCSTGDDLVELKMSKQTFEKLFPIEKRYNISQVGLGDCWWCAKMGSIIDTPKGRAYLYQLIEEQGDNLVVKFPETQKTIIFEKGKLNKLAPISIYKKDGKLEFGDGTARVFACKGVQILEQAYTQVRYAGFDASSPSEVVINDIFFMNREMQNLSGGYPTEVMKDFFPKGSYTVEEYNNRGSDFIKLLEENIGKPNTMITFATHHENFLGAFLPYDLVSNHCYNIVGYDKKTQMISISNPWHNNEVKVIPVYELDRYMNFFEISTIK